MGSYIYREKVETQTLTPNSMSPVPKRKFINYARVVAKNIDDIPAVAMYGKSIRQKEALEAYYDHYNY
jgi:hypothetical protein|tara:strand:- start:1383 stop:1586 length:204 start_codon:yes stop_codon:yes gene_type:complete